MCLKSRIYYLFLFPLCTLCLFLAHQPLNAQIKFEKEARVQESEVPFPARMMLDEINFDVKVKWFRELSEKGVSYEAKCKSGGLRYSIEFDSTGRFQDAEIDISQRELGDDLREKVERKLQETFDRFRIRKVQRQFTGPHDVIVKTLKSGIVQPGVTTKYEIVLKGRADRETHLYEYLFSDAGAVERKSRIVLRNTDHLVY